MAAYLVEEFVESEPTGRSWRVRAEDPLDAALKALSCDREPHAGNDALCMKVSPRNRFGRSELLDRRRLVSEARRRACLRADTFLPNS